MENTELIHEVDELQHHGIKGMRWGIRRFQNKDGSLTPAGKKRYGDDDTPGETDEARRERALKSTNAKEIYENRHLLTTNELNERINRIDTEARLASKIVEEPKRSGMDYVDKALKVGRKINEVYEFTNTPVMKALKKQLGVEEVEKRLGLDEIYKNRDKMSDKQLADALKRASTEKAIKKILDENAEALNKAKEKVKSDTNDSAKDKAETTETKDAKDTKPDDTPKAETTSTKTDTKPDDTPKTHVVDESELKYREQGSTEWKDLSSKSTRATGEDYINKLSGVGQTFRDNDKYAADKAREDYHKKLISVGTVMTDHDTSAGEQYIKKLYYARGTFVDEEHVKHVDDGADYLMHWKYTKREKINGKWRYWYGDTEEDLKEKERDDLQTKFVEELNELARKDGDSRYPGSDRLEKLGNEFKYDPSASKLQNVVDSIKDGLGVDERNQYAWTKHIKRMQDEDLARWQNEAETAYETYQRYPTAGGWTNYTNKERMVTAKSYDAEVANKFYDKYKSDFEKTPLGKVHVTSEKIKKHVTDIVENTKRKLKHSEEEMKNDELYHWKYKSRYKLNGKWRYIYDDKGRTTVTKKYNEYSVDDHKMYTTTERKVQTDSLLTPLNKTEIYTDSKGENHKTVTDYEGKIERAAQTGANYVANAIKKGVFNVALRVEMKKMTYDLKKKARALAG